MARRSSARLKNRNSSTPKRVSLSHDAAIHTPHTAPVKLQTLREYDEMPGAFPASISPPVVDVNKHAAKIPLNFNDSTPKESTPIVPAAEEMSPKHHQQSTAKPTEEARWLGFSNMAPHTEPAKRASKIAVLQGTPTKAPKSGIETSSPKFRFTFGREQSLELSPEAKRLMSEKREEALKIREQMIANGEGPRDLADFKERKFATPKSKKNRFSEVHLEQFKKMDSIAGHASAFRADPSRSKLATTTIKPPGEVQTSGSSAQEAPKSLKRSPSKAGLSEPDRSIRFTSQSEVTPSTIKIRTESLRASYKIPLGQNSTETPSAKRVKRAEADDASVASSFGEAVRSAQQTPKCSMNQMNTANLSTIASPTQASLARSTSVKSLKSSKIPGPAFPASTAKAAQRQPVVDTTKPSTPLLTRTPSKAPLFSNQSVEEPKHMLSPLLLRTPSKLSPSRRAAEVEDDGERKVEQAPLLCRSPFKMSRDQSANPKAEEQMSTSQAPLLARTPVKLAIPEDAAPKLSEKRPGSTLMGRFNLLRSSPMKSILRSPQRLYSNDPAKVAAGTHLASPATAAGDKNKVLPPSPGFATPVEKHVDFTSSTKARYEREQSEVDSTPSKGSTPVSKQKSGAKPSPKAAFADYPTLPTDEVESSPSPQKRRQTAAPGDFTFTSHGRGIVFGQSPNAPVSESIKNLPSTIRHVSAEPELPGLFAPATGSKKRKFDFENNEVANVEEASAISDKENEAEIEAERPAKRMRSAAPEPPAAKVPTRPPTLGVKPKKSAKDVKEKKPSVISRARLNALAQPKRKV